jgi:hypothetical protein
MVWCRTSYGSATRSLPGVATLATCGLDAMINGESGYPHEKPPASTCKSRGRSGLIRKNGSPSTPEECVGETQP